MIFLSYYFSNVVPCLLVSHTVYWIFSDVAAEKTQQTLIAGIEAFDATRLKHTETQEKNPLPDKDGKHLLLNSSMKTGCLF